MYIPLGILVSVAEKLVSGIREELRSAFENRSNEEKNRMVSELRVMLLEIKFNEIKSLLETIVKNKEITEFDKKQLINWYGKDSRNINTVVGELSEHSRSATFVEKPITWKDNEAFKNIKFDKMNLRRNVEMYIINNIENEARKLESSEVNCIEELIKNMEVVNEKISQLYDRLQDFYTS